MARPRKPEDPQRWPIGCARCRGHYELVATWPDGSICGYCYQAAKRTIGICACGHQGVLPGLIEDRPACRRCSGVRLNVDCISCGDEAELYSGGQCQRCGLRATAQRLLTNPDAGVIAPQLQLIVDALAEIVVADAPGRHPPTTTPSPPRPAERQCKPALEAFGRVDILVNDAGVLRDKAFHKMTPT